MILISVILTVIVFAPYLWAYRAGRTSFLLKKQVGISRCEFHLMKPTKVEIWDENFLALDEGRGLLLFFRYTEPASELLLNCNSINRLEVVPLKIRKKFQSKLEERLSRVELHAYQYGSDDPVRIILYDALTQDGEDYEMARAHRWAGYLKAFMGSFTPGKRVA